jgi:hypothetical protein
MLNKYRLFRRASGVFYWQDNESSKQGSLRTKDRKAAAKLLHVKSEAHRLPTLNLTMARAYLSAHDTKMSTRTWAVVMREMGTHGIASSQERCARTFYSKAFDPIRHKPLATRGMDSQLGRCEHLVGGDNRRAGRSSPAARHVPRQIFKANRGGHPAQPSSRFR